MSDMWLVNYLDFEMKVVALAVAVLNFWPRNESYISKYETLCSSLTVKYIISVYFIWSF
jgi:hypothetical protein